MNKILLSIKKEIKKNVFPKYKFIKGYHIEKVYNPRADYLGWYRHNSILNNGKPIIRLNIPVLIAESKKFGALSLYDIILTTILHELAHSIQQYNGGMGYYNETEAEDFAYFYWDFQDVLDIAKGK
jgi:hypothetical protein